MRRERSLSPERRSRSYVVNKIQRLQDELEEMQVREAKGKIFCSLPPFVALQNLLASMVPPMPRDALLLIFRELPFAQKWRLRRVCK